MKTQIAIGADHAGYRVKEQIKKHLSSLGVSFTDYGTDSEESVDYPVYAEKVARAVVAGEAEDGILICGSGIGIGIAANKIAGIRAALAWDEETAKLSRMHNDANVLTIGERTTPNETIPKIVEAFLNTKFLGGRHERRVEEITALENSKGGIAAKC
ncbi:MAG: ribose 5-phosphate isomerase B [Pyrinomonadaceae bacterium]